MEYRFGELSPDEVAELIDIALFQSKGNFGRDIGRRPLTPAEESLTLCRYTEVHDNSTIRVLAMRDEGWRWLRDAIRLGGPRAYRTLPWREIRAVLQQRRGVA
ncbi:hypothetical protein [Glycomyces halotolerans]